VRIARFTTGDEPSYGVVVGDLDQFGQPAEDAVVVELAGDPLYAGIRLLEKEHRLADVKLLAPVLPRSKIVGVGKNYAAHAAEMGGEQPADPLLFLKPNTSVIGPNDAILYPQQTSHLSYEGELAVVIGRICRDVPPEQATDVIFGYTIANDVTARDLQKTDNQWARAKGMDTFCPLGPWIEDDLDPQAFIDGRKVQTFLNGDVVQDGTTADMSWDIPHLIAYISAAMTLLPGDVILTGTPEGVGPMEPGDEVEVFVEGLGALTNTVARR
jgi:2-keto-4-pentenoate hydratase/2-oxohepta-3-ene-1,7-dioic acid hydratase in catechol pathway